MADAVGWTAHAVRTRCPLREGGPRIAWPTPPTGLLVILGLYSALVIGYGLTIPILEVPDELNHVEYSLYLTAFRRLPPMPAPFFEAHQPPLYYASLAPLITVLGFGHPEAFHAFVDPLELPVSAEGPFSDRRGARFFVHAGGEEFPYRGDVLLVHALRIASLPLGIAVIVVTYVFAMRLVPTDRAIALLAAGFVAFVPYFDVLSGAVTNDNLANLVGGFLLLAMADVWLHPARPRGRALIIGLLSGLALITKHTLVPLTAYAIVSLLVNSRPARAAFRSLPGWLAGVASVSGWYIARNLSVYGEPLPLKTQREHLARLGHVTTPPDRDMTGWMQYFTTFAGQWHDSFWGNMGILNRPLPPLVYAVYDCVVLFAVIGGMIAVLNWRSRRWPANGRASLALAAVIPLQVMATLYRDQTYFAAQGRYSYVLLPVIGFFVAAGLLQWFRPEQRMRAAAAVLALMFVTGVWILAVFVPRLYRSRQPEQPVTAPLKTNEPRFPGLRGFARHAQTFIARQDLNAIDVRFGTYAGRAVANPSMRLRATRDDSEVAVVSIPSASIADNGYTRFAFKPIDKSAGIEYCFEILLPSDGVTIGPAIWGTNVRPPGAVQRYVNGRAAVGFVDFRAIHGLPR